MKIMFSFKGVGVVINVAEQFFIHILLEIYLILKKVARKYVMDY